MQSRRVGFVRGIAPRRTQDIAEVPIEVLDVGIAVEGEPVFPEAQHGHDLVVKRLGARQVGHRYIYVVYSNDVGHGVRGNSIVAFGTIMPKPINQAAGGSMIHSICTSATA